MTIFEKIWEENSSIEESNNRVLNEIRASESECSTFLLECSEYNGWWGIWLTIGDAKLLVNPMELVSSIYKDDCYYLFDSPKEEVNAEKYAGRLYADIRLTNHVFEWQLGNIFVGKRCRELFTFEKYLSKIKEAVTKLQQVWIEGKQIAYQKFDAELENVEMCVKQLQIQCVLPSHYRRMTKDLLVEKFNFFPTENEWSETYCIGIGNRNYETWYSHWSCDFEQVRHQLESIAFDNEARICLNFDTSDTVISFKETSVLSQINRISNGGTGYEYKNYMLVWIEPNEFVHMPILKGYCDMKPTVKTFYEGLLKLAMEHPLSSNDDVPSKLVAYNKFKSPIIESYLRGDSLKDDEYAIRQVHVKHILRIEPGYDAILFDEENVGYESLEGLYDKEDKPFEIPDLINWQMEMRSIVVASETGRLYEKDWEDFHRRGLELAQQLRSRLSCDFDLWYTAPFEDKSGIIQNPVLII